MKYKTNNRHRLFNKHKNAKRWLLFTAFLSGIVFSTVSQAQYLSTQGTKIVDENGNEIFLSGINLGNWLLWEGYLMMGDFNYRTHSQFLNSLTQAFGSVSKAEEFEHQWRLNYVNDKAIADLKELGFNSVRIPFHYNMFWENGSLSNKGFQYIDQIIEACRDQGIYVLLDMHAAPGYQNPGDHSDNIDSNASQPRDTVRFWDGNNVDIASSVWRHIADRYKNEPVIWGYDLINEPVPQPGREFELLGSLIAMRNAIREVDTNHIIVAEGSWWGSDLTKIDWSDPLVQTETGISAQWDNNLVYQIHHYGPVSTTRGRENITNNLNIPLIIGEYGETDPGNLSAITDWAKQELSGYFPWSFKKVSHDKTLWTIPPNDIYNQVKDFINNGGTPPTHLYDEMIEFAKNNIRNGHFSHTWHQDFYDAIAPSGQVNQSGCETALVIELPGRVEAESFCQSSGLETESTGDVDGGQNIGFISPGDWGEYSIYVPSDGTYILELRVAGQSTSGQIEVKVGGVSIANVITPVTGDWQIYETVTHEVSLSEGVNRLRLDFLTGGFNLNWIEFKSGTTNTNPVDPCADTIHSLPTKIEAENYCAMQGVQTETTADIGGGENIGWIDDGDWTQYQLRVSESSDFIVTARVASQNGGGRMNIEVDGNNAGGYDIPATGGWQNWQSISIPMTLASGDHDIRFSFVNGGFNVNWVDFVEKSAPLDNDLVAGIYVITNEASGKVLDVAGVSSHNGANVHQWDYSGGLNQQWLVEPLNDGSYEVVSLNSGSCLDADLGSDNVHQWSCHDNSNQRWNIERQLSGFYIILSESGEALEVAGDSTVNGANVRTANLVQEPRQQWRFDLLN